MKLGGVASAVLMGLGLAGCGGGSNVKSTPPPPASGSGGGGTSNNTLVVGARSTLTVGTGESITKDVLLQVGATLDNSGAIGGANATAVGWDPTVGVGATTVKNHGGGSIEGQQVAVHLGFGGIVTNDGANTIIRSPQGIGVQVSNESGTINNSGGAVISGGSIAIYLEHGGSVTNDVGSTIKTTGSVGGDCGAGGDCAIFVASDAYTSTSMGGALTLTNAGTIIGNVQMIPTAMNEVTLWAGSLIQGDLEIGSGGSSLLLEGAAGTTQLYSQAVTGTTTYSGGVAKRGEGTWILDKDGVASGGVVVSSGTLQIGNGGTEGSIGNGNAIIYSGRLVFDRSDEVVISGDISSGNSEAYDGTLVQAGSGVLTLLTLGQIAPTHIEIQNGTLQIDNTGDKPAITGSNYTVASDTLNNSVLAFDSDLNIAYAGVISGTGSVIKNGSADVFLQAPNTYSGATTINTGTLLTMYALPGDAAVGVSGSLGGFTQGTPWPGLPGVAGNLANAGKVLVAHGDSAVGGNYVQSGTGSLAVSLGSKLAVTGTATLNGGTLEITGADSGYVSNTHTEVLTAAGGVTGTFDQLVKDSGVVFTSTTVQYDANSVWLDTTGLNVTTAAAGGGVSYTPASFGSAQRVQGAFTQLNGKIAAGNLSGVSSSFVQAAGEFQQAPTLQAAQASLQSLSGELYASSAAMTFESIDASSRALSDRFDNLLGSRSGYGAWTRSLDAGGDMARAGFGGVGFQMNGWLVGNDRPVGRSGVAGFAFGQSQGMQRLGIGLDHDISRSTEGMVYAGWLQGGWYAQGRAGFGHFQHQVGRRILLGYRSYGVSTQYAGNYGVVYGESGFRFDLGGYRVTPFVDVEYAGIRRDGFAEDGGVGFGLRANAQALSRWQTGLGMRIGHHWDLEGDRSVDVSARAQWRHTLGSQGDIFDASFVGMEQWQPVVGIGLSRYSGLFGVGLNAVLSKRTALNVGYDYELGQHERAQTFSARLNLAF
jgi:fibronectin-binding autotransporter adhesin